MDFDQFWMEMMIVSDPLKRVDLTKKEELPSKAFST